MFPDDLNTFFFVKCLLLFNCFYIHSFWLLIIRLNESSPHSYGEKLYVPKAASDLNGVYICKVSNQYGSASGVLYVNNQTGK